MPSVRICLRKNFPKLFAIASQLPDELPVFHDGKITSQAVVADDASSIWLWLEDGLFERFQNGSLRIVPGYDVSQAHNVSKVPKRIMFNAIYLEDGENGDGRGGK